jgi:hypothetical protein
MEVPSTVANTTIGVNKCVVERIHRMRILTVEVKAGLAVRKHRVVKSDGPSDLVFQSVKGGKPGNSGNSGNQRRSEKRLPYRGSTLTSQR